MSLSYSLEFLFLFPFYSLHDKFTTCSTSDLTKTVAFNTSDPENKSYLRSSYKFISWLFIEKIKKKTFLLVSFSFLLNSITYVVEIGFSFIYITFYH